jgi:hypothetical protein
VEVSFCVNQKMSQLIHVGDLIFEVGDRLVVQ